jgi:hypothetical protein
MICDRCNKHITMRYMLKVPVKTPERLEYLVRWVCEDCSHELVLWWLDGAVRARLSSIAADEDQTDRRIMTQQGIKPRPGPHLEF